jgi:osmotically-inducible protein OsmY
MEYARAELRWVLGGWSRGSLIESAAPGRVRGVIVDPAEARVVYTLLAPLRRRESLPIGAKVVGDARTPTPPQYVTLTRGVALLRSSSRVGTVTALWCDNATGAIRHILFAPGRVLLGRPTEYVLDASHIQGFAANKVALSMNAPALDTLASYRPDAAIERDARAVLGAALPSANARRGVKFFVQEGALHLGGLVETEEEVAQARAALDHIAGLRGVTSDLVSMESLAERVERQLASTLAAQGAKDADVRVLAEHGIVYLEGSAPTQEASAALERAARAVAGARVVLNHLAAPK